MMKEAKETNRDDVKTCRDIKRGKMMHSYVPVGVLQ